MDKRPEEEQEYYKEIVDLLNHYEEGWDIFINASKAKDYDYPVTRKKEFEDDPYLPDTWLALADKVISIIATKKFELDVYPNRIEIIRADQMLDAYTTTGLPDSYKHWSFGKRREEEERKYDQSKHLAYEIVINSVPCLAYCMDTNTPLMQMLVIAHASYGHNTVFKNNYMFQQFTDAENILADISSLREFQFECEQKYGWKEVSDFIDFCHAMQFMDTPDTANKKPLSRKDREEKAQKIKEAMSKTGIRESVFDHGAAESFNKANAGNDNGSRKGPRNILAYMADNAPHLADWQRHFMRMRSSLSQYFKPQIYTQVLNEGIATFTHDKILTSLFDIGLIDYGMYQEFKHSHHQVIYQPSAVQKQRNPRTGDIENVFVGANMNPYALGYGILVDIERICMEPNEEDKRWFPYIAGNGDWLGTIKHIMESCNDETFIESYLTPNIIRKFGLFAIEENDRKQYLEVTAVQTEEGFQALRSQLAKDKRIDDMIPNISVHNYQDRTDRCLVLRHQSSEGRLLDHETTQQILEFMHRYWEHPVVIESVDEAGQVLETHSSPMNYNYKLQRRADGPQRRPRP